MPDPRNTEPCIADGCTELGRERRITTIPIAGVVAKDTYVWCDTHWDEAWNAIHSQLAGQ